MTVVTGDVHPTNTPGRTPKKCFVYTFATGNPHCTVRFGWDVQKTYHQKIEYSLRYTLTHPFHQHIYEALTFCSIMSRKCVHIDLKLTHYLLKTQVILWK